MPETRKRITDDHLHQIRQARFLAGETTEGSPLLLVTFDAQGVKLPVGMGLTLREAESFIEDMNKALRKVFPHADAPIQGAEDDGQRA